MNRLKDEHNGGCHFQDFNLDDFYIIDIDRDGLNDIVYSGDCKREGGGTAIFRYNGNNFEQLIFVYGVIYQVSDYESILPFSFSLIIYACCGDDKNIIEKYALILEDGNYKFILQTSEYYYGDDVVTTIFPKTFFEKPIAFKTIKEKYNLRFSPSINYVDEDDQSMIFDNVVITYPKNSIGYDIAKKKDKTGRIWWFVKMDNKSAKGMENIGTFSPNSKESTYSLGWMSSKYLERID